MAQSKYSINVCFFVCLFVFVEGNYYKDAKIPALSFNTKYKLFKGALGGVCRRVAGCLGLIQGCIFCWCDWNITSQAVRLMICEVGNIKQRVSIA